MITTLDYLSARTWKRRSFQACERLAWQQYCKRKIQGNFANFNKKLFCQIKSHWKLEK